ncbi:CDP-alcohol phosphatidyltransferase family protein [Planktosalinus lacus]|uniref:Phosphatidylserine synthase n=1 Tax=Planktosalinus lacus TaxID=1526573 RepID=A0A8J2V8A4_9FLAO|nr:CDP-alcohol phosphatidyltransferase family protein [Planktosalinus lacus]GGD84156.1 phosphatidylserine synthase [Planktosalinus lacus]
MLRFIPNFITLLNLLFGCIAVVFAIQGNLPLAAGFVILGIFFDFFDGLAARALGIQSELGKQLDSLADVVTSGLVPGIIMMQLIHMACLESTPSNLWEGSSVNLTTDAFLPLLGLLITLGSAYRLAKFNIDERQTNTFIGLPTPANALWVISLPLILIYQPSDLAFDILLNPVVLIALTFLSTFLLNAPLKLFSLKFKTRSFKANSERYVFLIVSIALLIAFWFVAIPLIILLYLILSLISNKRERA